VTSPKPEAKAPDEAAAAGGADPMQWWGALTQQFQHIAASAMKDAAKQTAASTAKHVAKQVVKGAAKKVAARPAAKKAPARKRAS
jgi:hypothetical protein